MADIDDIKAKVESLDPSYVGDARVTTAGNQAIDRHTKASFGDAYLDAMAFYALHVLKMLDDAVAGEDGASGAVVAKRTGDLSIAYQSAGFNPLDPDATFTATIWGRMYLSYRNSRPDAHAFLV